MRCLPSPESTCQNMAWTFLARSTGAGPVCTCVQLCVDTNLNSGNQIIIAHKSHLQGIQTFGSLINIKHYLSFHTQQRMSRFDFGAVRSDCEWNALVCIRDQSNLRPIIRHYPGYSQSCVSPQLIRGNWRLSECGQVRAPAILASDWRRLIT